MSKQDQLRLLAQKIKEKSEEMTDDEIIADIRREIKRIGDAEFFKRYMHKDTRIPSKFSNYSTSHYLWAVLGRPEERFGEWMGEEKKGEHKPLFEDDENDASEGEVKDVI